MRTNLATLTERIHRLDISPEDLVERLLERIQRFDKEIHAYATVSSTILNEAHRRTMELKHGRARGPLHGIPVAVKDLIDTKAMRTTYGSRLYRNNIPERDSAVVTSLRSNGALIVGKTNCDEFGLGIATPNTRNPWSMNRIAGGSSGGSAATLAADTAIFALGTDTGGSIRIPASLCGITGLKPTHGVIPTAGVFPASWTMDHVGPMCRFASDLSFLLKCMGYEIVESTLKRPINLAVLSKFFNQAPLRIRHAVERCVDKLVSEDTVHATDISVPYLDDLFDAAETIDLAEVAVVHRTTFSHQPSMYKKVSRQFIQDGLKIDTADYTSAQATRRRAAKEFTVATKKYPILVTPAVLTQAPKIRRRIHPSTREYYALIAPSEIFNALGWPSLVIPVGFSDGLPVGVQFVAKPRKEYHLIDLASTYQAMSQWHLMTPPHFGDIRV